MIIKWGVSKLKNGKSLMCDSLKIDVIIDDNFYKKSVFFIKNLYFYKQIKFSNKRWIIL